MLDHVVSVVPLAAAGSALVAKLMYYILAWKIYRLGGADDAERLLRALRREIPDKHLPHSSSGAPSQGAGEDNDG